MESLPERFRQPRPHRRQLPHPEILETHLLQNLCSPTSFLRIRLQYPVGPHENLRRHL
jgi:hypothetical protein